MISQIMSWLYIGGIDDLPYIPSYLETVINVAQEWDQLQSIKEEYKTYDFGMLDLGVDQTDLIKEIINTIMLEIREGRKCYLHCAGGISRSSVIAIAFIKEYSNDNWDEAEEWVRIAHPPSKLLNQELLRITKEKW